MTKHQWKQPCCSVCRLFCISHLPCLLQLQLLYYLSRGEAAARTDTVASVQWAHTSPSPSREPWRSPEVRIGERGWSEHGASRVSSTQLSFSALKGTVVNSCYVPSHLYSVTNEPGEEANVLELKSENPKYSKICLSLNKTQCASVEKEIIVCLIQKKSFVPVTAYSEGMTFFPPP